LGGEGGPRKKRGMRRSATHTRKREIENNGNTAAWQHSRGKEKRNEKSRPVKTRRRAGIGTAGGGQGTTRIFVRTGSREPMGQKWYALEPSGDNQRARVDWSDQKNTYTISTSMRPSREGVGESNLKRSSQPKRVQQRANKNTNVVNVGRRRDRNPRKGENHDKRRRGKDYGKR